MYTNVEYDDQISKKISSKELLKNKWIDLVLDINFMTLPTFN